MNELLTFVVGDIGNLECPVHHKTPEFLIVDNKVKVTACCLDFREHVQKLAVQSAKNFINK